MVVMDCRLVPVVMVLKMTLTLDKSQTLTCLSMSNTPEALENMPSRLKTHFWN